MRIWSLHPSLLDTKGLVALWRETLLAQKVLLNETTGYKNHPQLHRFKTSNNPIGAIATYLCFIADEADLRGYNFNRDKIHQERLTSKIEVTLGQVEYEFAHLLNKLKVRDIDRYNKHITQQTLLTHPMFVIVKGEIEPWEIL